MKVTVFSVAIALLVSLSMISSDALAKRMGSGSNSGMQRNIAPSSSNINKSPAPATTTNTATTASTTKSSWMGPLMGLAAGGLLAAAFMGGAFDGISPIDIILLIVIVGGIFFLLRRRTQAIAQQPTPVMATDHNQYRQNEAHHTTGSSHVQIGSHIETTTPMQNVITNTMTQPAWFNELTFTQQAENWYVTLQAAWDKKEWTILNAITTDALFNELKAQRLTEADNNTTRVEEVHAKVREMVQENDQWLLTVNFSGYVSENEGAFAHAFNEFWHLVRIGEADGEWKLAGIQQA